VKEADSRITCRPNAESRGKRFGPTLQTNVTPKRFAPETSGEYEKYVLAMGLMVAPSVIWALIVVSDGQIPALVRKTN
jgi:hypothetical protein